jgi:hypothetical protein
MEWLNQQNACEAGKAWFQENNYSDPIEIIEYFLETENNLDWANWLIVRVMEYKEYVSYAVYAAEQGLDIYEEEYPEDMRPRMAIEAAKKCIENPSKQNKNYAAAYAADAAAAYTAAAAYAAAAATATAAAAAADDATAAAIAAAYAAADARKHMQIKILKYGLSLIKED